MANDVIGFPYSSAAATLYAIIRDDDGKVFETVGSTFEAYLTANLANYDTALAEQGTASRFYTFTFPSAITAGVYSIAVYLRAGGAPAEGDLAVAEGKIEWTGSVIVAQTGDSFARIGVAGAGLTDLASATNLAAIKAKTDTIGAGTVTVTSPVALDQNVTLVKGDDYKAADGRALDFINAAGTWPNLTGATINFKAAYTLQPTNSFTEETGSVIVATGANQQVRIEIEGTDTAGLPAGSYDYDVEATLSSGNTVTLVSSEGEPDVELTLLESHAP